MPAPQPVRPLRPLQLRWSLFRASLYSSAWMTLVLCGLGCLDLHSARSAENLWLNVARSSISTSELHGHVSVLADDMFEGREAGTRGGHAAAKYLLNRLKDAGLQPGGERNRFTQPFAGNFQNILAVLPGTDPGLQDEYVLVGAHYDHVGYGTRRNSYGPWGYIHNGADDNASGVAAVLEVIDALTQTQHRPRRSILFAFWDGEEKGLLGSQHWKQSPTIPLQAVKLAINVDMVGRLTDGRIEVGGTRSAFGARKLMSSTRLGDGLWLDFNWDFKNNSDHWTFNGAGIPSLYVHTGIHDDYHRPSDDVEKLNIDGIRQVSGYLLERLSELSDAQTLPQFRPNATQENSVARRKAEKPLPELVARLDFSWEYVVSHPATVVVRHVPVNSQAEKSGLAVGDRIVAVDGQPITSEATMPAIAWQAEADISLQVDRAGESEPRTISIPLNGNPTRLGLSWRADSAEPQAVYVTRVVAYSPADLAGIRVYDRIYALSGEPLSGADELLNRVRALLDQGEQRLQLQVESRGAIREVTVPLGPTVALPTDATL